jgi:hypothetical protein
MTPVDLVAIADAAAKLKDIGVFGLLVAFTIYVLLREDKRSKDFQAAADKREDLIRQEAIAREKIMRDSFELREKTFVEAMANNSEHFITALQAVVSDSTAATNKLTQLIEDSLADMRRKIEK